MVVDAYSGAQLESSDIELDLTLRSIGLYLGEGDKAGLERRPQFQQFCVGNLKSVVDGVKQPHSRSNSASSLHSVHHLHLDAAHLQYLKQQYSTFQLV